MQVVLAPGCDRAWREQLTHWQERELAALYRQGRHLPDRTNHGSDRRWCQAGCRTRNSFGRWHRTRRDSGHERVIIEPTGYGFDVLEVRRVVGWSVDPNTGVVMQLPEVWTLLGRWRVGRSMSASFATDRLYVIRED
jgi:hypothetical protein